MIFGRQGVRNCSIIKPQNSKSLGVQFIHIQRTSDKIIHTKHRQKESPKLWINKINKARGQAWHHRRRWNCWCPWQCSYPVWGDGDLFISLNLNTFKILLEGPWCFVHVWVYLFLGLPLNYIWKNRTSTLVLLFSNHSIYLRVFTLQPHYTLKFLSVFFCLIRHKLCLEWCKHLKWYGFLLSFDVCFTTMVWFLFPYNAW